MIWKIFKQNMRDCGNGANYGHVFHIDVIAQIFITRNEAKTLLSGCETSIPVEVRPKAKYVKKVYQKGSRGECYCTNGSGKKTYADKCLCN